MSSDVRQGMGPSRRRSSAASFVDSSVLLALALVVAGCTGESAPAAESNSDINSPDAALAAAPAAETSRPATVAELFPDGAERQLVLNNCATCHAVACAAMGQRTEARWQELEMAHREHVPNLPDEQRERIFAYLAEHFNDSRPEPDIPPEFIVQGCTPF